MINPLLLEVCAYNLQSCLITEETGAGRVELCANHSVGGTTPEIALIKQAVEKLSIAVYPIVRPRGGDFIYNKEEIGQIKKDIRLCKDIGCAGISTGVQAQNGRIDLELMRRIVEWAFPMRVTCHKVFDVIPDPFRAMEDLIDCGCKRILTSGQAPTAIEGENLLAQLVTIAAGRIIIMPGGGVRADNLERLISKTAAIEYHSSAITNVTSSELLADKNELNKMIHQVRSTYPHSAL